MRANGADDEQVARTFEIASYDGLDEFLDGELMENEEEMAKRMFAVSPERPCN